MFASLKHVFLLLIICGLCALSHAEDVMSAGQEPAAVDVAGSCTSAQQEEREKILSECNSKWQEWGVDPVPPASELIHPRQCKSGFSNAGVVAQGCFDSLITLPALLGQLYLMGLVSLSPTDTESFAYISQHGSLQDMRNMYTNIYVRSKCHLANYIEDQKYVANNCHSVAGKKVDCAPFLAEVQKAYECRRHPEMRREFNAQRAEIYAQADELYKEQQERKAIESKHQSDLQKIRNACSRYLNKYSESYSSMLLNPLGYLASEAANTVKINKEDLKKYNQCVKENAGGNKELMSEMLKHSSGVIEDVKSSVESLKCYREDIQAKLGCDVVLSLTGVAGISKEAIKKLGKKFFTKHFLAKKVADQLTPDERLALASKVLNGKSLTEKQKDAVLKAHNVGDGELGVDGTPAQLGNYTTAQLKEKMEILREAGFSVDEADALVRNKVVGFHGPIAEKMKALPSQISSYPGTRLPAHFSEKTKDDFNKAIGEAIFHHSGKPRKAGVNPATLQDIDAQIQDKLKILNRKGGGPMPTEKVEPVVATGGGKVTLTYTANDKKTKYIVNLNVIDDEHYFTIHKDTVGSIEYWGLRNRTDFFYCADKTRPDCHMPVEGWKRPR